MLGKKAIVTAATALGLIAGGAALTGGIAYGAGYITSPDIKDQTIVSRDIAAGGVGKSEIRADSVNGDELCDRTDACGAAVHWYNIEPGTIGEGSLDDNVRTKLNAPGGSQGPEGPQGPAGPQGEPGKNGVSGYDMATKTAAWPPDGAGHTLFVECPEGKVVIGGGYHTQTDEDLDSLTIFSSEPGIIGEGWRVSGKNPTDKPNDSLGINIKVYAICATLGEN